MTLQFRSLKWLYTPLAVLLFAAPLPAAPIWVEGEKPLRSTMNRHPWWYDQVKRDLLSGGDLLSNFHPGKAGEAEYRFRLPAAGAYDLWVRANPIQARLAYALDGEDWQPIDLEKAFDSVNIAADGKPDLRFLAWVKAGKRTLARGEHTIRFRMDSKNSNHGYLDCFVLTDEPFRPRGALRPERLAELSRQAERDNAGWFAFDPPLDRFAADSATDLRHLNEKTAGQDGRVGVEGGQFVLGGGTPVRFWAVNGPASKDRDDLRREARLLAKVGVNLVRLHSPVFDERGDPKPEAIRRAHAVVEEMKAQGIYTHFSIYFPLWLRPRADNPWLKGYDGKKHPFAALTFNPDFQAKYRTWWKELLLTPSPTTGKRLIDDPAVMGLEIINEDSYFFWTFNSNNIPDAQLRLLEKQFGDWLKARHGSIEAALKRWGTRLDRDRPDEGRVGFRPLWNLANERTPRDRETARFLVESQRGFYADTVRFLRDLGYKGLITASNWATASPPVLGPLEKYTYTVGDFIDRHGYFGCNGRGEAAEWSIRDGHTYADRSALRFDPEEPGKRRTFVHPVMDPHYAGKPSMISETTFNRPNRFRSEAPLFFAVYGALQGSDAIVHFAQDSPRWAVKPNFFMQPWTLMTPAMAGQFPAAALLYRRGLVKTSEPLVELNLKLDDLLDLRGTPLPQDAAFDELRLKDVPQNAADLKPGKVIDPLVHFAGRTNVLFSKDGGPARLADLGRYIDRKQQTVRSATGQLKLDYGKGLLTIDAPAAQGVSGALAAGGPLELTDLGVASKLDPGHVVAVSLDDRPLATSGKILLQVMSEEKATGYRTEPAGEGVKRIVRIGQDPWLVREIDGVVRLKRPDAARLRVFPLDLNGYPGKASGHAAEIRLQPKVLYYLIQP